MPPPFDGPTQTDHHPWRHHGSNKTNFQATEDHDLCVFVKKFTIGTSGRRLFALIDC